MTVQPQVMPQRCVYFFYLVLEGEGIFFHVGAYIFLN